MGTPDSKFECQNYIFNNNSWKTNRLVPNISSSTALASDSKFSDSKNINNCVGASYDLSVMQTFNTLDNYTTSDKKNYQLR